MEMAHESPYTSASMSLSGRTGILLPLVNQSLFLERTLDFPPAQHIGKELGKGGGVGAGVGGLPPLKRKRKNGVAYFRDCFRGFLLNDV